MHTSTRNLWPRGPSSRPASSARPTCSATRTRATSRFGSSAQRLEILLLLPRSRKTRQGTLGELRVPLVRRVTRWFLLQPLLLFAAILLCPDARAHDFCFARPPCVLPKEPSQQNVCWLHRCKTKTALLVSLCITAVGAHWVVSRDTQPRGSRQRSSC